MLKRIFDILMALIGIILLLPIFIIISVFIKLDSSEPIFYKQIRVGLNNNDFKLLKFRTMASGSDKKSLITIGNNDTRITKPGTFLRKYKLDELPQLINVLLGDMSLVGPRPEVRRYVSLYDKLQLRVLSVKPGITDLASIQFSNENELLKGQANPEKFYIENIMPKKLNLNLEYIQKMNFFYDLKLIILTIKKIL
ncbi:Sugar transferase involved in LPS biosynthesis (colanic, teichoic acid) [Maribacter sedimenticola]|uniref:Sugar transferase involved in LPS biosynthesis (Colanic, teichoic acid) n=1 Tax=Maribacter sedimenticola TaxID=228956 RepID=A0ABY1SJX3_9FLAO|nr:sugar transferase [Maribacter sedimenticola]SNR67098.1 Sugar transferase involved in LPS biosynthesis (colanic, teichoic acid) [Maribacter sedimenticola]